MPFSTLWERHFLKETLKIFLFVLICFYGIYVIIDYASHSRSFHHHSRPDWQATTLYYLFEFIKRLDVFIPFALLIATVRTLCKLNSHNELVALRASGVPIKTLLRPFVLLGLFCTLFLLITNEIFLPYALNNLKAMAQQHEKAKHKERAMRGVQQIVLQDDTILLYHHYDSVRKLFVDVYWIKSPNEIVHMKTLSHEETPQAKQIDYLIRNANHQLIPEDSFNSKIFPELHFNKERLVATIIQPDEESLLGLWDKLTLSDEMSEKQCQITSCFYHKLVLPWICLLAVLGPAPFCVHFSRQLPIFFIYACSIFGLVAMYLIMDAGLVLGKRQVLSPFIAICLPFLLFFGIVSWRYYKVR